MLFKHEQRKLPMKVGILRETKRWEDRRVAITPETADLIKKNYPHIELYAQSSSIRIHKDEEYERIGVPVVDDVSHCDVLIGVKEVSEEALIEGKTYFMFAHVAKKQAFNQGLFKEMAKKKITLIDHEYLTNKENNRLVFFGFWAGVVGAYYAFKGAAKRYLNKDIPGPEEAHDLNELHYFLKSLKMPPLKILITGGGRVASGALEIIHEMGIKEVTPTDFLNKEYKQAVYTQLDPEHYVVKEDGSYDRKEFYNEPEKYKSCFAPYLLATDVFIPCHFWNHKSPYFFTMKDVQSGRFAMSVIADVSCDVPGPIPTTIRTSTIKEPFYDIELASFKEKPAFSSSSNVTVMAVDNLPTALPYDASQYFARDIYYNVFPSLFGKDDEGIIERATILKDGKLTARYEYLKGYLES